jgi:hypothetical protein
VRKRTGRRFGIDTGDQWSLFVAAKILRILLILVVVGSAVAVYFYYFEKREQKGLFLSGNMEVTELRLGFKQPGDRKSVV